jgi:exosortase/archaeosortase family protein
MIGKIASIAASVALYFLLEPSWSALCRDSTFGVLSQFSSTALLEDDGIRVAYVRIPWSEACSGLNALAVMMGLAVWSGLTGSLSAFWKRMILAVGIAFGLNVARSLSIAAARVALAPAWEGETAHFLLGFLWIAIGVSVFARATRDHVALDTSLWVHAACVLAVVSVVGSWPGGRLAAGCGLTCLFMTARARAAKPSAIAGLLWISVGIVIAWSQMESFWLPWLLSSPYSGGQVLHRSPTAGIVWLGTVPILSMQPLAWWIVAPALALIFFRIAQSDTDLILVPAERRWIPLVASIGVPFLLPHFIGMPGSQILPSPALMPRTVSDSAYLIRAPGQAADLAVLWFGETGGGRHHSIESCMTLRQVEIQRLGKVIRRENVWVTEFFLHEGELHDTYASYLLSTVSPWSSAGIHLVFESPVASMDSDFFAKEAARTAEAIRVAATSDSTITSAFRLDVPRFEASSLSKGQGPSMSLASTY